MKKYAVYVVVFLCGILVFLLQFGYGKKYQPYTFYQVYLDDEKIGVISSKEDLEKHISKQGLIIQNQVLEYQDDIKIIESIHHTMGKVITNKNPYAKSYYSLKSLEQVYDKLHKYVDEEGKLIGEYDELEKLYNTFSPEYQLGIGLTKEGIINYDLLVQKIDNNIKKYEQEIINYLYNNRASLNLTTSEYNNIEGFHNNNLLEVSYSKYVDMKNYVEENEIYLHTDDIYEPLGINVKKITTYDINHMKVEDVYSKIIDRKPCTIEGYQFRIKATKAIELSNTTILGAMATTDYEIVGADDSDDIIVYVTDQEFFNDAIEEVTAVFVGQENYEAYVNGTQKPIASTGTIIENIYLNDDVTVKKTNISVKEKIYSDSASLASFLLYGDEIETSTAYAKVTDTVDDFSFNHGISVEEFFLSNPSFTSLDSIFYDGQPITITKINPKIGIVVVEHQVQDNVIKYDTIERQDSSMSKGSEYIEQKGVNGLMRTSQTVTKINGAFVSADNIVNEELQKAKTQIIRVGSKVVNSIGSVRNWLWPTNSYTIGSPYGYRGSGYDRGAGGMHYGLDITNKTGNPVYASNNGTIVTRTYHYSYGNYIIINHNNGYWTLYAHMKGFAKGLQVGSTVARGQTIGYIGMTGSATGPHVHFEIRVGKNDTGHTVNPRPYLNKS